MTNLIDQDKIEREKALDISQSFIVQAPAGSGKTELLIQRFLALLNQVNKPEEILAITFTKKAANEMRLRIIKALKQALLKEIPPSPHAKKTFDLATKILRRDKKLKWNLIDNPNRLSIQTIDSFCAYLTKQLPLLSQFGSPPDITTHPTSLYCEAVEEVLSHLEIASFNWSISIAHLLTHLDNDLNKLQRLLINLLARRDQWLPYLPFNNDSLAIKQQLENQLQLIITDTLTRAAVYFSTDTQERLLPLLWAGGYSLTHLPATDIGALPEWRHIADILLTKKLELRKKVLDIDFANKAMIQATLADITVLPLPYYEAKQWETLQALLYVLKVTVAQLRVTFKQHGQIDFIENTQAAIFALGEEEKPTDLSLFLDYQIRHILVDEFQDTSYSQYQLLEKLIAGWEKGEGRTLFIVGDPMQSIYRFRQAEVGLFMRMRRESIGQINLRPLTLSRNFRSLPMIVDWNNFHFSKIFPLNNNIAHGAVAFNHSVSAIVSDLSARVEIKSFVNTENESPNREADYIANLINQIKTNHPKETIAILVRSRSHLSAIIPALKKANIVYQAVEIDSLAAKQCIQDLLSLTCAMLHPADRIAWLSILRAPWCGLILNDLVCVANQPKEIIWEQITNPTIINQLSPDGQIRLQKMVSILNLKINERQRIPLRIWVENTWLLLGGPACLDNQADLADAQAFFNLLDHIEKHYPIIDINKLKEKMAELYATHPPHEHAVQIMTIHTAKGLEFDTVFLPQLEKKMPYDDKALLTSLERPLENEKMALLLAPLHETGNDPDILYEYIHQQHKIKSYYETDRLFYVAATRAKRGLYLTFNIKKNVDNKIKIEPGSFLEKIWPCFNESQKTLLSDPISSAQLNTDNQSQPNANTKYLIRLPIDWQHDYEDKHTIFTLHKKPPHFAMFENTLTAAGSIIHIILQQLSLLGITWWEKKSLSQQEQYLGLLLKRYHIPLAKINVAIDFILKCVTNTLQDPKGRWILHAHQEAKSEFALTTSINGKIENVIIDRTFIDEHHIRWIIDYKTTHQAGILTQHEIKYVEQLQSYAQALRVIDNRPIRLGLYFPSISHWKEWEYLV